MEVITQTRYNSELTITSKTPILSEVNVELHRMEEVWNIMEQETSQSEQAADTDLDLVRRRAALATAFQALPTYGSAEFWSLVEESQLKLAGLLKSYSPRSDKGVCVGVAWLARRTCEKP